jgi:predicted PurR-regulated permease PerM
MNSGITVILILIGIFWVIAKIISSISASIDNARKNREKIQRIKEKWGNRIVDKTKSLEERNEDIIQTHINKIKNGYQQRYYITSVQDRYCN